MFFNIANLDTKSVVAILGQDRSFVFALFRFPTQFLFAHPFLNFQVPSNSGYLTLSSRFRSCCTRWTKTRWFARAPTLSSIQYSTTNTSASNWTSCFLGSLANPICLLDWPAPYSSRSLLPPFWAPQRSSKGFRESPLLHDVVSSVRRASSSLLDQKIHAVLCGVFTTGSVDTPFVGSSRKRWWSWSKPKRILEDERSNVPMNSEGQILPLLCIINSTINTLNLYESFPIDVKTSGAVCLAGVLPRRSSGNDLFFWQIPHIEKGVVQTKLILHWPFLEPYPPTSVVCRQNRS